MFVICCFHLVCGCDVGSGFDFCSWSWIWSPHALFCLTLVPPLVWVSVSFVRFGFVLFVVGIRQCCFVCLIVFGFCLSMFCLFVVIPGYI